MGPTDKTPTECLACGGQWENGCTWCTGGLQDDAQRAAWLEHRSGEHVTPAGPPHSSTLRFDARRAICLSRLAACCDKRPDLGVAGLIARAMEFHKLSLEGLHFIDDKRLAELCERFVLLGQK